MHTAVPETPAVAVQLTGREPLFLVMNSRSGKQDSEATRQAIRTACAEAGRRCELLVVDRGADLNSAAQKAVTLAREQGGIVVAVGGDGTLNAVCQAVVGQGVPYLLLLQGLLSRMGEAENVISFGFENLTVRPNARPRMVKVAVDGEILRMRTPLTFRIAPHVLPLLIPRSAPTPEHP